MLLQINQGRNRRGAKLAQCINVHAFQVVGEVSIHVIVSNHSVHVGDRDQGKKENADQTNGREQAQALDRAGEQYQNKDHSQKQHKPRGVHTLLCQSVGADIKCHFGKRGGDQDQCKYRDHAGVKNAGWGAASVASFFHQEIKE